MHADACAARWHHLRNARKGKLGHQIEKGRELREFVRQLFLHHHEFRRSGHKNRQLILQMFIRCFCTVLLDDADPAEPLDHLLRVLKAHFVLFRELRHRIGHTGLFEVQKKPDLLLCEDHIKHPVFRIAVVDFSRKFLDITVRNQRRKLQDQFLLLRILGYVIRVLPVVPFVDHRVAGFPFLKTFSHNGFSFHFQGIPLFQAASQKSSLS